MRLPALGCFAAVMLVGCDRPTILTEISQGLQLEIVRGDAQTGPAGEELPDPLVVRVLDSKGKPVKDRLVNFRVVSGGGTMFAGASITNKDGIAQDYWTLGVDPGENVVEVRAVDPTTGDKLVFATFSATGTPTNFALRFDGVDDIVVIADHPSLAYAAGMTLEYWVKFDRVDVGQWNVIKDNEITRQFALGLGGPPGPSAEPRFRPHIRAGDPGSYFVFDGNSLIPADEWIHVAQTYDGNTLRLFVNGIPDGHLAINLPIVIEAVDMTMGNQIPTRFALDGVLDEVRLWDVARPAEQIQAAMETELTGTEPGLIGYWTLNEGTGDTAFDSSTNTNDGRLGGAVGADAADPVWTPDAAAVIPP